VLREFSESENKQQNQKVGRHLELQLVELGDTFVGALDSGGHCLL
jgi:hypothetical protein